MDIIHQAKNIDDSWRQPLSSALEAMDQTYLDEILYQDDWLPGKDNMFNAFSIPKDQVRFVLFGESPYPRAESANGYAFWDAAIESLWSETGLSKRVNRATSMRNIMKMLLIASDRLSTNDLSQGAIAQISKQHITQTNGQLFQNLLSRGFLLLNATPILRKDFVKKDAKMWLPFINQILISLSHNEFKPKLLLFGKIAEAIKKLESSKKFPIFASEHPYNLSFAQNPGIIEIFKELQVLEMA